jgi:hypothetical protein
MKALRWVGRVVGWFEARDRADYMLLVGVCFLAAAAMRGWYRLPSPDGTVAHPDAGLLIRDVELPLVFGLRIATALFAAAVALWALRRVRTVHRLRWGAWVLLAMILVLPLYILQWHPDIAAQSDLLYLQVDRVASDIESNSKELQRDWGDYQQFSPTQRFDGVLPGRLCRCVRRPQHLAHWVRLLRRGINLEITWFRQSFS